MQPKFVPYEKCSKKAKKRIDAQKRSDWNGVNPVTRIAEPVRNKYQRKPKYPLDYDE